MHGDLQEDRQGRPCIIATPLRNVALIPLLQAFHEMSPNGRHRMNGFSFSLALSIQRRPKTRQEEQKSDGHSNCGSRPLLMEASLSPLLSLSVHIGVEFLQPSPNKNAKANVVKWAKKGRELQRKHGRRRWSRSRGCLKFKFRTHARIFHPFPHPFTTHSLTFDKMW